MSNYKNYYRTFFKAALLVGVPVIFSRVLGLVREQYSLYLFGASWELDAYISAYRFPTILRNLLGEGAFSVVFISIFSALWPKNKKSAQRFFNQVISYLLVISLAISITAYFYTPSYISWIHKSTANFDLTVSLSRIMVFFINFISLAAIFMGVLNSQHKYLVPAISPAIGNIINIMLIYFGHSYFGINILAIGYLANAIIICLLQIPFIYKMGIGFKFNFKVTPRLKFFIRSFFPVAFGMAFFQVNQILSNRYSSQIEGGNSMMDKSSLIIQMAIAVLSAGISTALLPIISKAKEQVLRNQIYVESMKTTFLVVFPSVILFIAFGTEISTFIYKDLIILFAGDLGKIDTYAIDSIGRMITLSAPGILVYSLITMVTRAFQGMNLYIYPLVGSFVSTVFNYIIMYFCFPIIGIDILPVSLVFCAVLDLVILFYFLNKKTSQKIFTQQGFVFSLKNIIAGILVYSFIIMLYNNISLPNIILLPICLTIGFITHFAILLALREEMVVRMYRAIF